MPSELKTLMVKEIEQRLGSASAMILVGISGLKGSQTNEIRARASQEDVKIFLLKNSLASLVFDKQGRKEIAQYLEGPTLAIYGEDPIAIAKFTTKLTAEKIFAANMKLRGGWLINKHCTVQEVKALSAMPPYEQMVTTFLATVSSPVTNLLSAVSSPISNLMNVLEQVSDSVVESKAS